ncbi:MAG: flagellar motor protein MotA [Rhodospirillaceae bacterium]|jgi:biopolymer transport protein ExbB|nr:flagellar motor protein MotA [Rhodospirillales bacterium]MAX47520.1 flagellar motor protein MotA [Rhodospirillaceae bacterium]
MDTTLLDRAYDFLQAGGPVVMILVAMSVIALAIILVKLLQFRNARLNDLKPAKTALALWRAGRIEEAISTAGKSRNPVAQAIARGLRGHHRGLPDTMIREEVMRYGGDVLQNMRAWFRPLEVIASLAPLLGLFGTVLGMITAFQQLESAGNQVNPAILSGGIWVALLTTAVGLAVAMPVVVILNWLERRVDRLAHNMDNYVTQLFTQDLSTDEVVPASAANSSRQQPRFHTVPALAGE